MTQLVVSPSFLALAVLTLGASFAGCTGSADGDGPEPVDRSVYPEGPYGAAEGDLIEDHAFTQPDGTGIAFQDLRATEANKLLLLSTAAGWCTACREEQGTLQDLQDTHGPDGLVVLVTIFEDNNSLAADTDFVAAWIDQYDLTLDAVLDADFVMAAYYDETLTPMNMFVDLDTMEIIRITTGFDQAVVDGIIASQLTP